MIKDYVEPGVYSAGQEVQLIIKTMTDLGYKAIVDGSYWGVLFYNEVFQDLDKDQEIKAYIKQIRPDGKIDLTLHRTGHHDAEQIAEALLAALKDAGGFLPLGAKTEPEEIYRLFGVSKKKFKMAVSHLYKKRLISIEEEGIHHPPKIAR
jgi:predicted RNA-binding protein (virulence factor B family)